MPGITPRPILTPAGFYRRIHPAEELIVSTSDGPIRFRFDKSVDVRAGFPAGVTARVQQRVKPAEGV